VRPRISTQAAAGALRNLAADNANRARIGEVAVRGARLRARSHCRFALPPIGFIPDSPTYIFGASISEAIMRPRPSSPPPPHAAVGVASTAPDAAPAGDALNMLGVLHAAACCGDPQPEMHAV
jgi:hypothetical protein